MFDLDSPIFQGLCNRIFHPGTRSKGEQLYRENKVLHCEVTNVGLQCDATAKVQGAAPYPYEVTVSCSQQGKSVIFNAKCTCPVIENCKHIYAVLLVVRDKSAEAPQNAFRRAIFQAAAHAAAPAASGSATTTAAAAGTVA